MPDQLPTSAGCAVCMAPTGDSGRLCRTHTDDLRSKLDSVPALLDELEVTVTRQDKLSPFTDRRSTAETPLYWNEAASQAIWDLNATLRAWATEVAAVEQDTERDPFSDVDQTDTAAVATWLRRNRDTIRKLEHAGQAHDELSNTITRARSRIDYPNTRTRFEVGPCPEAIDGGFCDGTVWAFISSSEDKLSYMRCEECEMKWDSTQWLRVGPRIYRRSNQLKSAS